MHNDDDNGGDGGCGDGIKYTCHDRFNQSGPHDAPYKYIDV